ncbi:MAG TPA: PrsW family glutamic-type intramembrane protease [Dehalococcoidia bacterium]|nr:PrsW family glutamic-type intramembrane protease [Dehalococcoidia bacterium]
MIRVPMPTWTRWILFSAALLCWWLGLVLSFGGFAAWAQAKASADPLAEVVLGSVGVVLYVAGCGLGLLAMPKFTGITGIALAPVFALAALAMLSGAVAVQRYGEMDDPARASTALIVGGVLCLGLALLFLANWLAWIKQPGASATVTHVLRAAAIWWGTLLVAQAVEAAVLAFAELSRGVGLHGDGHDHLFLVLTYAGSAAIYIAAGAVLFWHGAGALTGVPSRGYRPPAFWKPGLIAVTAIGAGAVLLLGNAAIWLLPLLHVLAVLLPGISILALVSRAGRRGGLQAHSSWREITLMVAYGAALAATVAGIVNTTLLVAEFLPFLGEFNRRSVTALNDRTAFVLLLIGISVLAPLDEEFCKGFGVRLLKRHNPTRYQAFLWGLASGVGFGMVEANAYGAGAFHQSAYRWWDGVLLRGAASSLHALTSSIVGIGWFYCFRGRRLRFAGFYLLAVVLHGSWNAMNLLTVARVLPGFKRLSDHAVEIGLEVGLAIIALGILTVLWRLARRLAHDDTSPAELPPAPPLSAARPLPAASASA